MASKYAAVMANLERFTGGEPAYQEKVEAVKAEILNRKEEFGYEQVSRSEVEERLEALSRDLGALYDLMIASPAGKRQAVALAEAYRQCRLVKDALDKATADTELLLEAYTKLLVDQYEVEGVMSLKLVTGESISDQPEPYAQVEDRDAFRQWCLDNGLERSLMLPWQTTNALTKDRLLNGLSEPDGVKAFVKHKMVLRK